MNTNVKEKISSFFSQFPFKTFSKGELILSSEQNPPGGYYLKTGYIRQYSVSKEGVELTIHIFSPQSYFPMTWIISNISNRYYYEAMTEVEVYLSPKNQILEFLKNDSEVFFELTSRLLIGLDKLSSRIENLIYDQADKKLISTLIFLSRHFGLKEKDAVRFSQKFTHKDIAAFAGISRETASRTWEKLENQGLLQYDKQIILISDIKKLETKLQE